MGGGGKRRWWGGGGEQTKQLHHPEAQLTSLLEKNSPAAVHTICACQPFVVAVELRDIEAVGPQAEVGREEGEGTK